MYEFLESTALRGSYFGDGSGPYHLSEVRCNSGGRDSTLLRCSYTRSTIGCTPGHDAAVNCDGNVAVLFTLSLILTPTCMYSCICASVHRLFYNE